MDSITSIDLIEHLRNVIYKTCGGDLLLLKNNYNKSEIFEIICCLQRSEELNKTILPWSLVPHDLKEKINLPQIDVGLDMISLDLDYAGQAKKYDPKKSKISSEDRNRVFLCVYRARDSYKEKRVFTIVEILSPPGVKVTRGKLDYEFTHIYITEEMWNKWISKADVVMNPVPEKEIKTMVVKEETENSESDDENEDDNTNNENEGNTNRFTIVIEKADPIDKLIGKLKIKPNIIPKLIEPIKIEEDEPILRNCQINALNYLRSEFNLENSSFNKKSYKFCMPCGSGKTLTVSEFLVDVQNVTNCNFCILVPNILLVEQWMSHFEKYTKFKIDCLGGTYLFDSTKEYTQVISTYQSFFKIADREFDYYIIDEAHHILESKGVETGYLETIRYSLEKSKGITLYFSATLKEADFNYTMREAIEEGILVDYTIHIPMFTNKNYYQALVEYLLEHPEMTSVLAYSNTVEGSEEFRDLCNSLGLRAVSMNGEDKLEKRKEILEDFELGKYRVLCSVNVLGEGINLPFADTCLFVDPKYSEKMIIQNMGRVSRTCKGKIMAHVIFPAIDLNTNFELVEVSCLKFLKKIIKYDKTVEKSFRNRGSRVSFEKMGGEEVEMAEFVREILVNREMEIINYGDWMFKYLATKEYFELKGNLPPKGTKHNDLNIGQWLNSQRKAFNGNGTYKITPERIALLDQLTLNWRPKKESNEDLWNNNYLALKEYYEINKKLPSQKINYNSLNIGTWLIRQQQAFEKHDVINLTQEKILLLDQITLNWRPEEDKWNSNYLALKEYYEINKKLPSQKINYNSLNIGTWLNSQREAFKGQNKSKITQEKIVLLDQITLDWKKPKEEINNEKWNNNYLALKEYYEINKKLPSQKINYNSFNIGSWLKTQQQAFNEKGSCKITCERILLLDQITFEWRPEDNDVRWNNNYLALKEYYEINKKLPSVSIKYNSFNIGTWLKVQKRAFNEKGGCKITPERIALLDEITHVWRPDIN